MSEQLAARMSATQKIGQVMMIGFGGTSLTPDLRQAIIDLHPGGLIIFERNVDSPQALAQLTADVQALARQNGDPPLFIAIDQEGGRVARLKEARGFTEFPGAMAIAASGSVANATGVARALARELRSLGVNMNMAPVLDVNNNPQNPVIGIRSFGSNPQHVAAFGVAFAQGLQAEGVCAVGKHFPGHGDTGTDSHVALPTVPHDRARLADVEFVPFTSVMAGGQESGIAAIMSAHVTFPAIDPTPGLAATLSPAVLTGLLRDAMRFDGLLLTDSLEMGALAQSGYPAPRAAAAALAAGADMLLFNQGHDLHRQAQAMIADWLRNGQVSEERLNAAVRRVLRAKARFGLLGTTPQPDAALAGAPAHKETARQTALQAVTLLRNTEHTLPLAAGAKLLVVETPNAAGLGRALDATTMTVGANPSAGEISAVQSAAQDGRVVVVGTSDAAVGSAQARLANALLQARIRMVVVAMRGPYDLLAVPEAKTYVAIYGGNPPMLDALAAVLYGRAAPHGRLPVDIPGLYQAGSGLSAFTAGQ